MKPLTIELKPGERQGFTFVGWRMNGVAFYARDEDANPRIVELSPAYPHCLDDGQPFAFPILEPAEIFPTRLLPPSCVASKKDINGFTERLFREIALYPQRKHEQALRRTLKWCHAKARKDQAAEIAAVKNATPLELLPFDAFRAALGTPNSPRQPEAIQAERLRRIREIEDKYRSRVTLTLEELKRGEDDYTQTLRDHVLITSWAKDTGTDMEKMKLAAREFASQWDRAWGSDHLPSPDAMPNDQAAVRLGIRFALSATFYLRGVRIRSLLTPAEVDDFNKLEQINPTGKSDQQTQIAAQPAAASAPPARPDSQFEYVNLQGTEWRKAGPQMVRRGVLAEHQRTTKDHNAFRSLLEINRERWFYPVKQIAEVRQATKGRTDSPVAAMFDITDWDSNWHPPGAPNWKHPGKKSETFRVNQS